VGEKAFDPVVAEDAVEGILAHALGEQREGAVRNLRGDETTWARVLELARSGSLFVERRALVVRDADALKGEAEGLDEFLADPTPELTLILVARKPDKRRTAWKRLLETAHVKKADPPRGPQRRAYVERQLERHGLKLGQEAMEELLTRIGTDVARLGGELDKLEAYAEGGRLTAAEVAKVLARGQGQPLYRLSDAFAARKRSDVLGLLERGLDDREEPLKIAAVLQRTLRDIRGARAVREAGLPRREWAGRLQVPPYKLDDLQAWERQWSLAELRGALAALARADRSLKQGAEGRVALLTAVVAALRPSRPGR
jgi:DNA polymerase-3 subunit delta